MQEIFGVRPFLGDAANATDLSDLFTAFPVTPPRASSPAGPGRYWAVPRMTIARGLLPAAVVAPRVLSAPVVAFTE